MILPAKTVFFGCAICFFVVKEIPAMSEDCCKEGILKQQGVEANSNVKKFLLPADGVHGDTELHKVLRYNPEGEVDFFQELEQEYEVGDNEEKLLRGICNYLRGVIDKLRTLRRERVKYLLDRGIDPNVTNDARQLPLDLAIKNGDTEIAEILKKASRKEA